MKPQSRLLEMTASSLIPVAAIALTAGIFIADTVTDLEIAVPVFYTAVILISVSFCDRRGVVLFGVGCMALTLLSDLLTPTTRVSESGIINTLISLSAIAATTYLVLKIETAEGAVHEARAQLAHFARVTALGELTASLAHEVNQPLAATVINGSASLRWLAADPPDLDEARQAIERIVKDAHRASETIGRVRALAKRSPPQKDWLDINQTVGEVTMLTTSEMQRHRISLKTDLQAILPPVLGDRVQLQQVILNLILNAIDAAREVSDGPRDLIVSAAREGSSMVVVTFRDTGTGLDLKTTDRLFNAFYTTKKEGMGMGLTISRSIIESHGGRIWARPNEPRGAIFQFTLPIEEAGTAISSGVFGERMR